MPLVCMFILDGCATADKPAIVAVPSPPATELPRQTSKAAPVTKQKQVVTVKPAPEKPQPRPRTEILLSGEAPAYREIAERLNDSLDDTTILHTLTGVAATDDRIVEQLRRSPHRQLVAIGLRAAIAARELTDKQVVFCQVVNFRDHRLVSESMKGVGAMPAPDKLFADWKSLSPQLRQVLVVTGDGFDDYIAMAREAASRSDIELIHRVVDTDREFAYTVKRDALPTQGHWMLADNRVLSFKTLKDVMPSEREISE